MSFMDLADVNVSTVFTSAPITVSGIMRRLRPVAGGRTPLVAARARSQRCGSVTNGQTVCVRHTSAAATTSTSTADQGGVADTFTSTTSVPDTTPDAFTFVDQANVDLSVVITSAPVGIIGLTRCRSRLQAANIPLAVPPASASPPVSLAADGLRTPH